VKHTLAFQLFATVPFAYPMASLHARRCALNILTGTAELPPSAVPVHILRLDKGHPGNIAIAQRIGMWPYHV